MLKHTLNLFNQMNCTIEDVRGIGLHMSDLSDSKENKGFILFISYFVN